jgi:hypothetical protein
MNENRLSRALFNNKSCKLGGTAAAANTARTLSQTASEEDDEWEQVSVSGEGLGTDKALVFWDTCNSRLILSHALREQRL